jgi:hypothetical protein
MRRARKLRLALIDERTMLGILASLEEELGEQSCLEAISNATSAVTAIFAAGLKGELARYGTVKRRALEDIEEYSLLLGMGRIELEKLTPGEGGSMMLRQPIDLGIVSSAMKGTLEAMDRCSYDCIAADLGDSVFRLEFRADEKDSFEGERKVYALSYNRQSAVHVGLETCKTCGLPASLAPLRWDELHGSIEAGVGGRRVAFFPAYILEAFAALERPTKARGSAGIVHDAVFASIKGSLDDGADDAYESPADHAAADLIKNTRDKMVVRGWGAVSGGKMGEDGWRVDVTNPVDDSLVAGWLRALYTFMNGRETRVKIREKPPLKVFELE